MPLTIPALFSANVETKKKPWEEPRSGETMRVGKFDKKEIERG